jgi:hypothetical protein
MILYNTAFKTTHTLNIASRSASPYTPQRKILGAPLLRLKHLEEEHVDYAVCIIPRDVLNVVPEDGWKLGRSM